MYCNFIYRSWHLPITFIAYSSIFKINAELMNEIRQEETGIDPIISLVAGLFASRVSENYFFNHYLSCIDLAGRISLINTCISILSIFVNSIIPNNNQPLNFLNKKMILATLMNSITFNFFSTYMIISKYFPHEMQIKTK